MVPKYKFCNGGNLDIPMRSNKVLSLREKGKILNLNKEKLYAEVTKIYNKNKSFNSHITFIRVYCFNYACTGRITVINIESEISILSSNSD